MTTGDKGQGKSLPQSEDRFRLLFDGAADALFLHDLEGRFVEVNQAACDSLGYSREEVLQLPMSTIVKCGMPGARPEMWARVLRGEKVTAQGYHQRRDGSTFPVEVRLSPFDYAGRPHILAAARDISDRVRAEEALRTSESFLNSILDQSPYPMWISDAQGTLIRLNQACQDLLLITPAEVVGKYNIFKDNIVEQQGFFPLLRRVFEKGETVGFELTYDTSLLKAIPIKTAKVVILDVTVSPLVDAKGVITNAVFQHVDITERKRAEAALELSEKKYRSFYQSMLEGFVSVDMAGHILETNQSYLKMIGYTAEEVQGLRFQDITPPKWHKFEADIIEQQVLTRGYSDTYEKEYIRKDGTVFPVELRAYLIEDKAGAAADMWAFVRDITQRKQMEESLARTQVGVDRARDAIHWVKPDGGLDYVNQAFCDSLGYSRDELLSLSIFDIDPKLNREQWPEHWQKARELGSLIIETLHKTKDGRIFPVEVAINFITFDGEEYHCAFARDISERKKADEARRDSERRLSEIIDFLPDATFAIDLAGKVIAWNRAIEQMTGVKAESILGKGDYEYALPFYGLRRPILIDLVYLSDEEIEKKYIFVQRQGDVLLAEADVPLKGKMHLLWGKARPLYDREGNIVGAIEAIRDVTERRQSESALRESEARFRQVVESSPLPIGIGNDAGMIEYVNPKFVETFGYTLEDLPRITDWFRLAYPDPAYRQAIFSSWQESLEKITRENGATEVEEVEITCKDGSKLIMEGFVTLMGNKSLVVFRDLTVRKRTEDALRESETRFRQAVEHSPLAIAILNGDQGEYLNPRFIETLGYTLEDIPSLTEWFQLAYPDPTYRQSIIKQWEKSLKKAMAGGQAIQGLEVEVTCKDGSVRTMDICGALVGSKILAFCNDLTERKRAADERAKLEAQMREVQKLESLGILAGGIAHDFNNLLMAILGNADLALLALSPASPARPNIEEIVLASQRAADLCRQMLAYSGKGRFVVGRYDLSEIVREMAQMLKVTVSKKATLRYSFAADLPPVEVDATQIRQVIMNLITNASEALGDNNGIISISTGIMACDRDYLSESHLDDHLPAGDYVYLKVADTGCGLDEETRRRIFDPFFTTKFTGRGLGLAAVLGIVRSHQGAIKVASDPGKGTTFTILLPAVAWQPGDRTQTIKLFEAPHHQGIILLIDDDPHVRRVAGEMLGRLGLQVLTAAHGKEGLKIFRGRGGEIDCVILDLTMPGMGGEDAFKKMRRLRPDVRVILSSGYDEEDATEQFAGQGLAGFIQKPYTVANLQEVLNRVLGQ